jgi:uncharacterized membrane protein YfcA
MSTTGLTLILVFGALGAFVQALTGFGGSLVLAPVLFATMKPAQAVLVSALLGVVQTGVIVARTRHEVLMHELRWLLVCALPGLGAGVLVLRVASTPVLRVAVGVSVVAATIARRLLAPGRAMPGTAVAPAGFLAGLLTTSVTVNGPPLVLYLTGRGATPAQLRATLSAAFIALDAVTVVALAVGGAWAAPPVAAIVAGALAFPVGLLGGIWLGPRVPPHVHARAVTGLLLALGVGSIVAGLAA